MDEEPLFEAPRRDGPKMGRRRGAAPPVDEDNLTEDPAGQDEAPPPATQGFGEEEMDVSQGMNQAKSGWGGEPAQSGWGAAETNEPRAGGIAADFDEPDDAPKFTGVSRRKAATQGFMETGGDDTGFSSRGGPDRRKHDEPAEEMQILEIPELEEAADEDITRQVAAVPKFRSNRIQTINDLDQDSHIALPSNTDSDIDFSLLTSVLCTLDQVRENDEAWDADRLLAELASDLNLEKEEMEKDENADNKASEDTSIKEMM